MSSEGAKKQFNTRCKALRKFRSKWRAEPWTYSNGSGNWNPCPARLCFQTFASGD